MLEISHCDVKEASVCDLRNTWDDRLCEVHHCPVTHELWLLVCSVRSPLALNCVSRWKPTLSTVCLLQTAAVAYLLQAWSRALGLFFFYSFLPYCIMYNLSYSGSWDSTLSPFHFNLKPLLSFCILHWLWSVYDTTQVCLCCVQLTDFDICGIGACPQKKRRKTQFLFSLSLSCPLFATLSLFLRIIEYSVTLLRTRRPHSLLSQEASCSCIRWNSVINQIKMSFLLTAPAWIYGLLFQWIYCIIMYGYEYYMEPHTGCMVRRLIAEFNY